MTLPRDIRSPLRLVAVGDVGRRAAYHVGDEAMLKGLIATARRGSIPVAWTVMSADPSRTAEAWDVRAVPRLTFEDCADAAERDARLAALDRVLHADPAGWAHSAPPWREGLAAIAGCDAVIIAGGGNLSRSWPHEVFERSAIARVARRAGRPVAITSQTLGPSFDDRTRALTAELVREAVVVGLREASSHALAIELGAPPNRTVLQFDDAVGVRPAEPPWWREVASDAPVIAVTVNQLGDMQNAQGTAALVGRQLAEVSRLTGAAVVIVPHVGDLAGTPAHDVLVGRAIAAAASGARVTPLPTPEQAVWIAGRAELVVSTRYHPIVFGLATTTPALFLSQDHYTFVKGVGALNLAGLGSWTLPVAAAAAGLLVPATLELWHRRHAVRAHLQQLAPVIEARHRRHVEDLLTALASGSRQPTSGEPMPLSCGPAASDGWVEEAHGGRALLDAAARVSQLETQVGGAEDAIAALTREVDRKDASLRIAQAALEEQERSTRAAHAAWQAERAAIVSQYEQVRSRLSADTLAREIERKEADLNVARTALEEQARAMSDAHAAWQAEHAALAAHAAQLERRAREAEQAAEALGREVERKESELRIAHAALEELTRTTHEAHAAWQADRAALVAHGERAGASAAEAARMIDALTREIERKEADLLTAHAVLAEHARRQA